MSTKQLLTWLVVAAVAGAAIAVTLPQVFPFLLVDWEVTSLEAKTLALSRLAELGPLPEDPYVVVKSNGEGLLERRMLQALAERGREELLASPFLQHYMGWQVFVYRRDAPPNEPSFMALVSPQGRLSALRMNLPADQAAGPLEAAEARRRADAHLRDAGFDLATLGEPELRSEQRARRTDLELRYPARERLLGSSVVYGVKVTFLGDELGGYSPWMDDPEERAVAQTFQQRFYVEFLYTVLQIFLLPVLVVPFVRKYHEGVIGVRRGIQILAVTLAAGIWAVAVSAQDFSQGSSVGVLPRSQLTLLVALWALAFLVLPTALLGAVAWSVGESQTRERHGSKLAAFDALFRGGWDTATVARSSLKGIVLGVALLALQLVVALPLHRAGFHSYAGFQVETTLISGWPGVASGLWLLSRSLPGLLLTCLFFSSLFERRLGLRGSSLVGAALAVLATSPMLVPVPLSGGFLVWFLFAAAPVLVFAFTDLLTALLCGMVARAVLEMLPLLLSDDRWLQFQGCLPLVMLALPLLVSVRRLHGGEEIPYRYDDIPPHVRRIAERERHRVELETAREIQSSILPELPAQLAGIELAHVYQPATEVGGDFYDVLALEDGRLAVAVGDVAGHGVSSGLVMSMVKSALAVQVTFDPEVEAVFTTLNRMVFQSARRRMLTTLSYALVDPRRRELIYASAGHIFPYRVTARGKVYELEAGEYPLGVRSDLLPRVHRERLEPSDSVVLLSDGVIERTPEGSTEAYGYERFRDSLSRHGGSSPRAMVGGILRDLEAFTGQYPREDDVTVLVLRLPAA